MFDFVTRRWRMSEGEAGNRIGAARTARRFPVIFDMIARGDMHLTGVNKLKAHLTEENHRAVLDEARRKSVREIEELVARIAPRPDRQSRLRALPRRRSPEPEPDPRADPHGGLFGAAPEPAEPGPPAPEPNRPSRPPAARRAWRARDPEPLSPERFGLVLTIGRQACEDLRELQGLLAHRFPDRDPAAIVELALAELRRKTLKRKAGLTDRPRPRRRHTSEPEPWTSEGRHIPAEVRRAVHERDGGTCSFVGVDGRRCGSADGLQFGHIQPWAKGGEHTVENVALRCQAHNLYEAEREYGEAYIASKRRRKRGGGQLDLLREARARYAPEPLRPDAARAPYRPLMPGLA